MSPYFGHYEPQSLTGTSPLHSKGLHIACVECRPSVQELLRVSMQPNEEKLGYLYPGAVSSPPAMRQSPPMREATWHDFVCLPVW
jgi:hypothetical protein